jgi:DNA helicase HerA-like ATPase
MDLNDVQEGVLNIAFRIADEQGLLLIDLKDLRAVLSLIAEHAQELGAQYGNVSKATVGTIQRALLVLENQGGTKFFGEPALALTDFLRVDRDGRGTINVLAAEKLMENPRLYATFLLWLLSELFEELPEVGDPDKPKLVFFFDEAHLLFNEAPKALLEKIEQVIRLIRSKGVGVYFVTQKSAGCARQRAGAAQQPDSARAEGVHAARSARGEAAADTFRPNPKLDTARVIMELGKGEALVSLLEGNGTPGMVERTMIAPPASRIGPITPDERKAIIAKSPCKGKYDQALDAESAFEVLQVRAKGASAAAPAQSRSRPARGSGGGLLGEIGMLGGIFGTGAARGTRLVRAAGGARSHAFGCQPRCRSDHSPVSGRSLGGKTGGTIGRAMRGTLGG